MKLFVYYDSGFNPESIHAIKNFTNKNVAITEKVKKGMSVIKVEESKK